MLIFFLLGLLSFPSKMPTIFLPAMGIALFLTFVGRPLTVGVIMAPFKAKLPQLLIISWAGLRGAASIVFAIMVMVKGIPLQYDLFHIVFCVVLFSIGIQGSLLPLLSRKLNMIDTEGNVMKTFNDYNEEKEIQFIQLQMEKNHPWVGKQIKDVELLPDTLLVLLLRGEESLIPKGDTEIEDQDTVILSANAYEDDTLIIMVRREDQAMIPSGSTEILAGDVVVVNENRTK